MRSKEEKKMADKKTERKKKIKALIYDKHYRPMKQKEIGYLMQVTPEDRPEFVKLLQELVEEGSIEVTKRGKYKPIEKEVLKGVFTCTKNGYGFVTVEGKEEDYYIYEKNWNGAFHEDTVLMESIDSQPRSGHRKEGKIIKILERGMKTVVGTLEKNQNFGFVVPDNQRFQSDIFLSKGECGNLISGFKVLVKVTDYGDERHSPEGKIVEVLGHRDDPRVDILSIVKAYDIPTEFEESVNEQVESIPDTVIAEQYPMRKDLRELPTVTIDGEDAKDLDDAITLSKDGEEYLLGVHIADVSEYVSENSPLDREALKRGTSVYLVDRVIPMLPHQLSNGICSLNAGCDRLALSCLMRIDRNGKVLDHEIAETLIKVDERMTYTDVAAIIDHDAETRKKYESFVPMFELMKELSDILRERRHARGSIDFDFPESKIILDEKGHTVEVFPQVRNAATKIIEDFMLCANETVAEDFYWREIPFLYRTHDIPDGEKIDKLQSFLQNFGIYLKINREELHPMEVQKLLTKIEGTPEEPLISRLTLRSMKQAKYTVQCSLHFGLSTRYYCHFTSPIRRYPDLQIHRIIKENLHGKFTPKRFTHYEEILPQVADHTSKMERRAEETEREVEKLKKAEYMERRIGEVHEGIISSITSWGVYVELPNTVEGMIHVSKLPGDFYYYDENTYSMVGERTGRQFKLGEHVKIRVADVDMLLKNIDFDLEEDTYGERNWDEADCQ